MIDHAPDLLEVRDQGMRGTCLAFAATAVHEHARHRRRARVCDQLSVELLFWRCKQLDGYPADDGTTFQAARAALSDPGQSAEALWPYDDARDHTANYDAPTEALGADELRRATMEPIAAELGAVRVALEAGHSLVVGIELWDGFYDCGSADLPAPNADLDGAGHAVCLVGFDEDRRSVKVRNSWGTRWGEHGYAWLSVDALPEVLREAWTADDDLDPH